MKRLVALQVKCRLSVLVVADDSTKTVNNALLALAAADITVDNIEDSDLSDLSDKSESSDRSDSPEPARSAPSRAERRRAEKSVRKYNQALNSQRVTPLNKILGLV